jgi:4-hydroxybenzoate polyprenyltransferase
MITSISHLTYFQGRSITQILSDLRLNYALVSSTLVFLGFFLNHLEGFDWPFVVVFLSFFCANVFGFVVNDFYDARSDGHEIGKKTRNLFCSPNTKQLATCVLYASLSLSFVFSGIVSPSILLIIILFNTLAFVYSAPPVQLRNRPYWDWIFVFLWKGVIIFTGQFYFSGLIIPQDPFVIGVLTMILLLSLLSQINNQIRDFKVDKLTNTANSSQHMGLRSASSLHRFLLSIFYSFSFVFCAVFGLYITIMLLLLNISLYYLVQPKKYGNILEFANVWIISVFLEYFKVYFSYQQQQIITIGIMLTIGIVVWYGKHINLFKRARTRVAL